ncbi:hypothetical protein [Sphingobium xanthum]|uniref:hypothetical protein n=1 Tax=Sphingobium xanthum TaxID=1387165 RepID=UPI001C8BA7DE|nr:hypothetical protein [Sphingobium xanthum]
MASRTKYLTVPVAVEGVTIRACSTRRRHSISADHRLMPIRGAAKHSDVYLTWGDPAEAVARNWRHRQLS